MTDAGNPWAVSFSRTSFLDRYLRTHRNISSTKRERDILFTVNRAAQRDELKVLGCDEYVFSLALVMRALEDFGELHMICVGGVWNKYSEQAKEYCQQNHIGLYNFKEIGGGLWLNKYWSFTKKDDDGNPIFNASS